MAKTNMKLGGLNYSIRISPSTWPDVLSKDVLYVGFDLDKPAGGLASGARSTAPNVLGWAANTNAQSFEFVGDFAYVPNAKESAYKTETFAEIIGYCIQKFEKSRGAKPKRIVVYRHGCDEGQWRVVARYEIPFIEAKLAEFYADEAQVCKWAYIVPNKLHAARIYKGEVSGFEILTLEKADF